MEWLKSLPHRVKVFVCGNHDFSACTAKGFYETRGRELNAKYNVKDAHDDVEKANHVLSKANLGEGLVYLDNEEWGFTVDRDGVRGKRWKVWGSPWSPVFEDWAWNYDRGEEARGTYDTPPGLVWVQAC